MTTDADESGDVFDVQRIRELIELMREFDLNEIDLRHAPRRIKLKRGAETILAPALAAAAAAPSAAAGVPAIASAAPADTLPTQTIKSPMVGTFYSRPKPDQPPFVKIGDVISADTVVCIVEAMKMFNEIPAGVSGRVVEVCVQDGDPVDVNKPLFKVAV